MSDKKNDSIEMWTDYGAIRSLARNRLLKAHHRLVTWNFVKYFAGINVQSSVLDIGCGDGFFLEQLRNLGYVKIKGIDLGEVSVQKARNKGLDVSIKSAYDIDSENTTFDIVIMTDVLEHLDDPNKALLKIYNVLNKGGIYYLNIPVWDSINMRLKRFLLREKRLTQSNNWDETHIFAPDTKEILSMLKNAGFKIVKYKRLCNQPPQIIKNLFARNLYDIERITLFGLFGDILVVEAKK